MKKSEILRILNREEGNNVKFYCQSNISTSILVVYINVISWKSLNLLNEWIIDIAASEDGENMIRVSFCKIELD